MSWVIWIITICFTLTDLSVMIILAIMFREFLNHDYRQMDDRVITFWLLIFTMWFMVSTAWRIIT